MSFFSDMFAPKPEKVPDQASVDEARRRRLLANSIAKNKQSTVFTGPGGAAGSPLLGRATATLEPGGGGLGG